MGHGGAVEPALSVLSFRQYRYFGFLGRPYRAGMDGSFFWRAVPARASGDYRHRAVPIAMSVLCIVWVSLKASP